MSYKSENAERYTNISKVFQFVNWVNDCCDTSFHRSNVYFRIDNCLRPLCWLSRGVSEFCDCIKYWSFNNDHVPYISIDGYIPLGKYLLEHLPELNEYKGNKYWTISVESIIRNFETLKQHLAE